MNESKIKPKLPAPPRYLSPDAAEIWRGVIVYLSSNGRLEAVDGSVIEGFCMAVTRQRLLQAELDRTGVLGADNKPNPLLRCTEAVAASVKNFAAVLGLSPAARKGLPANSTKKKTKGADVWVGVLDEQ
jgi:P27 family predicted phage terminase small subunit